ncbi:MAG: biopolymer transporter ExbD [Rhodothermaceae bacterium]|nr:biopolymer transporter ExbD [Rhodothermaceae bacterium]
MPLLQRRTSREAEIPTASMADIAFLLLIFFLVTTTINVDSGIYMQLPPKLEEDTPPPEIRQRNLLAVLVNSTGDVLVDGEFMQISQIRGEVVRHVTNEGRLPNYSENPDLAIVSFKTERGLPYGRYIEVLDEIKSAYIEIRDDYSRQVAGVDYTTYKGQLGEDDEDAVATKYPIKISLAEPDPGVGGAAAPAG